jgi:hypothetical protein
MTRVFHWHAETKQLVGVSMANESPLEPGVILVPAHATLVEPSGSLAEGHVWVWKDGVWEAEALPEPELEPIPEEVPPRDPMDLLRAHRNKLLSQTDWRVIKAYSMGEPVSADWAAYMQALRDLPAISTPTLAEDGMLDMTSVMWPVPPST